MSDSTNPQTAEKPEAYRVLARKYRPQNFDELIGQDALVRTLKNAIEMDRIAHAFMLTGVRGVGKTTTARIIAKALNYVGPEGNAGPTIGATDDCGLCKAISEDRHPDVIEMDAASRTGVDDIREILDGVRYAPTEARYKVYIIDEVHMLSKQAFNALLKTLEEPPAHVKFIFATTEIRKVPITVLSRCQRFDLRRVDVPTLDAHFKKIVEAEGAKADDEAIGLIARAADGSVRDGLSLLDQAISLGGDNITATQVQDMLGLADRARGLDVLEKSLTGDMPAALDIMADLYKAGADPVQVMQDLLDLTHLLTKIRAVPQTSESDHALAPDTIKRAAALAKDLTMPTLGKTWQLLLKGLQEVQTAPNPQSAAEMVLIRLTYAADLPDPADLIKKIQNGAGDVVGSSTPSPSAPVTPPRETVMASGTEPAPTSAPTSGPAPASAPNHTSATVPASEHILPPTESHYVKSNQGSTPGATAAALAAQPEEAFSTEITSLEDVVRVLENASEVLLASQVYQFVHLVKLQEGHLEINLEPQAAPKFSQDLRSALIKATGRQWMISIATTPGAPTLAQQAQAAKMAEYDEVLNMPVIQDILKVFPDAKLTDIKKIEEN